MLPASRPQLKASIGCNRSSMPRLSSFRLCLAHSTRLSAPDHLAVWFWAPKHLL